MSAMVDLHRFREAKSAQGPPSATERRQCKIRVTLLLRDAAAQVESTIWLPTTDACGDCGDDLACSLSPF